MTLRTGRGTAPPALSAPDKGDAIESAATQDSRAMLRASVSMSILLVASPPAPASAKVRLAAPDRQRCPEAHPPRDNTRSVIGADAGAAPTKRDGTGKEAKPGRFIP